MNRVLIAVALAVLLAPAATMAATVRAPANTVVMVELAREVSTKTAKPGDTFPIRLAEPLVIGNQLVLPVGTEGIGEVIEATKPGYGGKAAKLVLSAKTLTPPKGQPVPLKALQLSGAGKAQAAASNALGLGGIGFAPLGVVAFAIKSGDVGFPAGTMATAKLACPLGHGWLVVAMCRREGGWVRESVGAKVVEVGLFKLWWWSRLV